MPYGPEALRALNRFISEAKITDPLAPVTVVVERGVVGLAVRRLLASGWAGGGSQGGACGGAGAGIANVSFVPPAHLAEQLAGPAMSLSGRLPLDEVLLQGVVRSVLGERRRGRLAGSAHHAATVRSIAATYRDLRDVPGGALDRLAGHGSRASEVAEVVRAIREQVEPHFYDQRDLFDLAREVVDGTPDLAAAVGAVAWYLPTSLPPHERELLEALAAKRSCVVFIGSTGDPRADREGLDLANKLAGGDSPFSISLPERVVAASSVVSAPSADAEVHHAVRTAVEHNGAGVPLERIAIAYSTDDPYGRLLRDRLHGAGIPFHGGPRSPLGGSVAGRTLLGLVTLLEEGWEEPAASSWASVNPVRFDLLASLPEVASRQTARCAELDRERRWGGWSRWATGVLHEYLGNDAERLDWPVEETEAFNSVVQLLATMARLDGMEGGPGLGEFRVALGTALEDPAPPVSRFGHGVFIGTISQLIGLHFEVCLMLGLHEGAWGGRPGDDPVLPDRIRAAADLPLRGTQPGDRARQFLAALAAAAECTVSFSRGDQRRGRLQRPSRFWLDSLGAVSDSDRRLYSRDIDSVLPSGKYRVIHSLVDSVGRRGQAIDPSDYDTRSLLSWVGSGTKIDRHPLWSSDPVLVSVVETRRARRSLRFTRFDGFADSLGIPTPSGGVAQSATRLQEYAQCPRRYLFSTVLGLQEPEESGAAYRMSPRDRGTVVHRILEEFLRDQVRLPVGERIAPTRPWADADRERLLAIARRVFAACEREGLTGRHVFWQVDRAGIEWDLVAFLRSDSEYRAARGVVPDAVELAFGPEHHLPVGVAMPDGSSVILRGVIDRVDRGADGSTVVIDYKSGRPREMEELATDPVVRGTQLQLPLYAMAVRGRAGTSTVHAFYWFVSEAGGFRMFGYPIDRERMDRFNGVLSSIVGGIEAGLFPARPGDKMGNCTHCPFDTLCPPDRIRQWEGKRDDPRLADYRNLAEPPAPEECA